MSADENARLIRFETIDEIKARTAFREVADGTTAAPRVAVGLYDFPEDAQQPCGLSNCKTAHGKGFLIELKSGDEILVGQVCGSKKMGFEFQKLINEAIAADRNARSRDAIEEVLKDALNLHSRIDTLMSMPTGARWLAKQTSHARRLLPPEVIHALSRMARIGESAVYVDKQLSKEQSAIRRETENAPRGIVYERKTVGNLKGLNIWKTDLRALLVDDIQGGLSALVAFYKDDRVPTNSQLRKDSSWARALSGKFERVEALLNEGTAFFNPVNLRLLKYLSSDERPIVGIEDGIAALERACR